MRQFGQKAWHRFTKCDSGETLNPLMHVFLFVVLVLSIGFLFFGHTKSVQSYVLYKESMLWIDTLAVSVWGIIGATVVVLHTVAFWIRGRVGQQLMRVCVFGGGYLWFYASVIYLQGGFVFQFLSVALPNLAFWAWYARQWQRRKSGYRIAFV